MKRFVGVVAVAALYGCGASTVSGPESQLLISLASPTVNATRGSRVAVSVEVTRVDGALSTVSVSVDSPSGVTASVSSESTTGTTTTASLSIVVSSSTLTGQYPLVIHAKATGFADAQAQLVVDVVSPPPP
jgi:uncharacterized membrane protein